MQKSAALSYLGEFREYVKHPARLLDVVVGVPEYRDDMKPRARGDGARFGQAFANETTHKLTFLIEGEGETPSQREENLRVHRADFEMFWQADRLRHTPGALATLRVGDRECYGQPRITGMDLLSAWDGVAVYMVDFIAVSSDWYAAYDPVYRYGTVVAPSVIPLVPHDSRGLRFPARAPFTFTKSAMPSYSIVENPGIKPAFPVFEIHPNGHRGVIDPAIHVPGVGSLELRLTVPWDKTLKIVTSPHGRGVYLSGDPVPGAVKASGLRLSETLIPPGRHEVSYRADDGTGLSELTVTVTPILEF